jgi:pyruvate/2-oxoglutarate dehydrogenase complex dihydrolipoamide dehydrogenase (E3) component
MSTVLHYDIVVIGSGPAGQKAAIQGAKAGKRVAVIEREPGVGGSCVYRGTIPSKTLRETVVGDIEHNCPFEPHGLHADASFGRGRHVTRRLYDEPADA